MKIELNLKEVHQVAALIAIVREAGEHLVRLCNFDRGLELWKRRLPESHEDLAMTWEEQAKLGELGHDAGEIALKLKSVVLNIAPAILADISVALPAGAFPLHAGKATPDAGITGAATLGDEAASAALGTDSVHEKSLGRLNLGLGDAACDAGHERE
jgi:hypothetical protein